LNANWKLSGQWIHVLIKKIQSNLLNPGVIEQNASIHAHAQPHWFWGGSSSGALAPNSIACWGMYGLVSSG